MSVFNPSPRTGRVCFAFLLFLACGTTAFAQTQAQRVSAAISGAGWTVATVSGEVALTQRDGTKAPIAAGDTLAVGAGVATGNGRATLVRGKSHITVSPQSAVAIGDNGGDSLYTRIIQTLGTLLFEVEKNPMQRFEVETPYLAATVKGTVFTVSLQQAGTTVHVTEGAVQVASFDGRSSVLVRPGQSATMATDPGSSIELRQRDSSNDTNDGAGAQSAAVDTDSTGQNGNGGTPTLSQTVGHG